MKIKISFIALTYILAFGLIACSQESVPVSLSPIPTLTETVTMKPPSSIPFPTTPTYMPVSSCIADIEPLPQVLPVQGKIVLSGVLHLSGISLSAPSYLLNLVSGEKILLPQEESKTIVDGSLSISLDREWMLYAQANANPGEPLNETLHLVTADGVEYKVISMDIDQRGSLWVDDNHLLIEDLKENWSPPQVEASLWLLNPFTEERKELLNDYPNQWNGDNLEWEFTLSRVIYNPTLTRVIYPTFADPDRVMRLVNAETGKILTDIPTTDYGKYPAWSPDGKQLAFATQTNERADWESYQDEIFALSADGKLVQLTHLSKINNYAYITGLSWSADGRHIAFWVNNTDWEKGRTGVHLAIVDTTTGVVNEYCDMRGSDGLIYVPDGEDLVWSPGGDYLVVNLADPNDQNILVVIVETSSGRIFQITENYRAIGWVR